MSGWYISESKSDNATQKKADALRAQEHAESVEWSEAWDKLKAEERARRAERKRAYEESQKPQPSIDEDMRAVRKLLEAQAETK